MIGRILPFPRRKSSRRLGIADEMREEYGGRVLGE
jgi:hypothetical protein